MERTIRSLVFLVFGMFLFFGYTVEEETPAVNDTSFVLYGPADTVRVEYKGRVKEIIDKKCYDCHSEKGDDEEAKEELLWDELPKLDPLDQVYVLDAIAESVEKGDMPPFKHVLFRPHKKLTDEEAKLLIDWAKDLADKLDKGMD